MEHWKRADRLVSIGLQVMSRVSSLLKKSIFRYGMRYIIQPDFSQELTGSILLKLTIQNLREKFQEISSPYEHCG
jgi:hypothetical protein